MQQHIFSLIVFTYVSRRQKKCINHMGIITENDFYGLKIHIHVQNWCHDQNLRIKKCLHGCFP